MTNYQIVKNTLINDLKSKEFKIISFIAIYLLLAVFTPFVWVFDPVTDLFGFPCPGCGMTRATLALLRLDFVAAFKYNPSIYIGILLLIYVPLRNIKLFTNLNIKPNKVILYAGLLVIAIFVFRIFTEWGSEVIHFERDAIIPSLLGL